LPEQIVAAAEKFNFCHRASDMRPMKWTTHIFACMLLGSNAIIVSSCVTAPENPPPLSSSLSLSEQEIGEKTVQAHKGDAGAATALALHFAFVETDEVKAAYWLKLAAKLGGHKERENYRVFLENRETSQ
jgi:hypothetical protein